MKNKNHLYKKIFDNRVNIQEECPELTKYLDEMPTNLSESASNPISKKSLAEYYNTLNELLKKYEKVHTKLKKIKREL